MHAQTRREAVTGSQARVTPGTPALVAVLQPARGTVVTCGDDAAGGAGNNNAAHAALHAVGAVRGEGGKGHEVGVPGRAEAVRVEEVEFAEVDVEGGERGGGVEETEGGRGGGRGGEEVDCGLAGERMVELRVGEGGEGFEGACWLVGARWGVCEMEGVEGAAGCV